MSVPNTQKVIGNLYDLGLTPESVEEITVCLSEPLVLYGDENQLIGDETSIAIDDYGNWEKEFADTDNMPGGEHYIFEIASRVYKKYIPISVHDWQFNDLPDVAS